MKTVITAKSNNLSSPFDQRFGRAAYYCVYDDENGNTEFVKNDNENAQGGAGTKAAEKMAELNVNKVISGDFGPKAKDLLNRLKIQMVAIPDDDKTIEDIINSLK